MKSIKVNPDLGRSGVYGKIKKYGTNHIYEINYMSLPYNTLQDLSSPTS